VLRNVTITLSEEAAKWARRKAAEENTSVSRLVGQMIERQMHQDDDYVDAYRQWKKLAPMKLDADHRLSRDDAHSRR
jgi:hypothetical protein